MPEPGLANDGSSRALLDDYRLQPTARPAVVTLRTLTDAYLQEYEVRQFRINIARCRVAYLLAGRSR